jgi:hypothetical protein
LHDLSGSDPAALGLDRPTAGPKMTHADEVDEGMK